MNRQGNFYYSSGPSEMSFKEAFYAGAIDRLDGDYYTACPFNFASLPEGWSQSDLLICNDPYVSGWLLGWWSCHRAVDFHTDVNAIHNKISGAAEMAAMLWTSVQRV